MDTKKLTILILVLVSLAETQGKSLSEKLPDTDYNDDGDYDIIDDINENDDIEDENSEDNSEFSDELSEDKINYENENYNGDDDYNSDDIKEDEKDDIEDEDDTNGASAADLIYSANQKANLPSQKNVFEDDIMIDEGRKQEVADWINGTMITKRAAIKGDRYRWPQKTLTYRFDSTYTHTKTNFMQAISEISTKTCVKFKEDTTSTGGSYVRIFKGGGCYSYVGFLNQRSQDLSIGDGCNYRGTIIHELLHALGFWHEQSRPDRDKYVTIIFGNIQAGRDGNFKKHAEDIVEELGVPYDYKSVMHYGKYAFSTQYGVLATIVPKGDPNIQLGQRNGMSDNDAKKLNLYYKCSSNPLSPAPSTNAPPTTTPPTTPPITGAKSCDFENGLCGWNNIGFRRRSGGTPSRGTGPNGDHTTGQGFYIYFETSRPVNPGDTASIDSELSEATDALCVSFWYNMLGRGMGELAMGTTIPNSNTLDEFWSKKGNQGADWKKASVTVRSTERFHIAFLAIRGPSWSSDIALDDIVLKPGSCTVAPVTPVAPVTSTKCNFATDFCSFTNTGDNVKFILRAGYILMRADRAKSKTGDMTSLISPELSPTQNTCIKFRYRLSAYGGIGFAVSFTDQNGGNQKQLVTFSGRRGWYGWNEYEIQFQSSVIYKVIFEAWRGMWTSSRLNLDNISIGPGPCTKSVCGDSVYDPATKTCCAGVVHNNEAGKQCCGSYYYTVSNTVQCCSKGSRVISTLATC